VVQCRYEEYLALREHLGESKPPLTAERAVAK
jgi:hypothetical protein